MQLTYSTLPADEPALRALINRIRAALGDRPRAPALPFSPLPGVDDAGWQAGPAGEPGGYAWIRRQTGGRALVEIDALPADLPAAFGPLLAACRKQAAAWECGRLVAYVPDTEADLAEAYRDAGFTPAGKVDDLHIEIPETLPEVAAPEGHFLKPYHELRHLPTLAALLHRAYHDRISRPEFETDGVTVDTVRAEIEADPEDEIERDYFLLLNFFGKGVGVVRCRGQDWIDGPGVVPEERGNDLGRPLLFAALHHIREQGSQAAWMVAFDEEPDRIDDYRQAGFNHLERKTCWQMERS